MLLSPGASLLALDFARRWRFLSGLRGLELWTYLATSTGASLLWALLLVVAASRRGGLRRVGAWVFTLLFAFAFAVQHAFFSRYRVYVNIEPLIFVDQIPAGVLAALPLGRSVLGPLLLLGGLAALALVWLARKTLRPSWSWRTRAPALALVAVVAAFAVPVSPPVPRQAAAPEIMYFHGVAVLVNDRLKRKLRDVKPTIVRVQRRTPEAVPALNARPPAKRNVILLLQEA